MDLPIVPMEPAPAAAPFDDPAWTYEVKWDGVRNVTLAEDGRVRLLSRRGRDRTAAFPELGGLAARVRARRAVLDGELVVPGPDGRPDFFGVLERDRVVSPAAARARAERRPACLMVFDLLEVDGEDLIGRPLRERQERLRDLVRPGGGLFLVDSLPGAGTSLFRAVAAAGLEGIVCKRLDSPYRFGPAKSPLWRKVKRRLEMLCVVGGYTVTAGRPGALLVGAYDGDGRLRYLGRAGAGLRAAELAALRAHLRPAPCPFDPVPDLGAGRRARSPGAVVWVVPELVVRVEYQDRTESGRLRSPVIRGFVAVPPGTVRLDGAGG